MSKRRNLPDRTLNIPNNSAQAQEAPPDPTRAELDRLRREHNDLLDASNHAARRIRSIGNLLGLAESSDLRLHDSDYWTIAEVLDWIAGELKAQADEP